MNSVVETIGLTNRLRTIDSQQLIDELAPLTRSVFETEPGITEAVPVIICARNEVQDLPATLVSLAMSECRVMPIVVDDVSTDETGLVAKRMGAQVIKHEVPGKLGAFKKALSFAIEELPSAKTILALDADTIAGRNWAQSMIKASESLQETEINNLVFGLAVIRHGKSAVTDFIKTGEATIRQVERHIRHKPAGARGHNMALALTPANLEAINAIPEVPKNLFPNDDVAIRNAIVDSGGIVKSTFEAEATVVIRGDRFSSLSDIVNTRVGKISVLDLYKRGYPEDNLPISKIN